MEIKLDLSQAQNLLNKPAQIIEEELDQAAEKVEKLVLGYIDELTPDRTGDLLESISGDVQQAGNDLQVVWSSDLSYAPYVEEDTHNKDGSVKTQGHHMFEYGLNKHLDEVQEVLEEAGQRVANRLEGK